MPTFNINCLATVTLTPEGKQILKSHFKNYPALAKINDKNEYSAPLWRLFSVFGSHLHMGAKQLFKENDITLSA